MRREIVTCPALVTDPVDETEIYVHNKDRFLEEVRLHLGADKGNVYFYSPFEGITQVAVEFASANGFPVTKLTGIVAAARTGCSEADQYSPYALEEFLNRYKGSSIAIKENYATARRRDYVEVVGAALNYTFRHYKKRGGQVFIFGPLEPTELLEGICNKPEPMSLVHFVPYRTSD